MVPLVAIIGRPNVGKSTLFNALIQKRRALVSPIPGTTRDHLTERVTFAGQELFLLDTAGLEAKPKPTTKEDSFKLNVQEQVRHVKDSAHLIIHVVDAQTEITKEDQEVAAIIRKTGKPVILVANKADNPTLATASYNFHRLGKQACLLSVSAFHKTGLAELKQAIASTLKLHYKGQLARSHSKRAKIINIAIVGRPNVGKSSLLNAIIGRNQAIVFPLAGTTLDANDTPFTYQGQDFNIIDTAGIRKRGKIGRGIEYYSVTRSLSAIARADVVILVLDTETGIAKQDLHIAQFAKEAGTGLILAFNKWDLADTAKYAREQHLMHLQHEFDFVPFASVVFTSALKGTNCKQFLPLAQDIVAARQLKIKAADLKFWLADTVVKHPPSPRNRSRPLPKIYSVTQTATQPPAFTFLMRHADDLHFAYPRYLERRLREKFGFHGTTIELRFLETGSGKERRSTNRPKRHRR